MWFFYLSQSITFFERITISPLPGKRTSACANGRLCRRLLSEAREEMRDSHGGGGPVASLHAAVLAEGDIEALVNKRLVGVVVVGQQRLLELALVHEDSLETETVGEEGKRRKDRDGG